jgi:hypothetical protein
MPKKLLPQFVAPMQASSVKAPFDSSDWIFETKLDGYRAIAVPPLAGFQPTADISALENLPVVAFDV